MKKFLLFVLAIAISFLPGIIGMMFSPDGASDIWYNTLMKPAVTPDGWVFAVVWPILYFLFAAVYLYYIVYVIVLIFSYYENEFIKDAEEE